VKSRNIAELQQVAMTRRGRHLFERTPSPLTIRAIAGGHQDRRKRSFEHDLSALTGRGKKLDLSIAQARSVHSRILSSRDELDLSAIEGSIRFGRPTTSHERDDRFTGIFSDGIPAAT
jgi:hypothetical protein